MFYGPDLPIWYICIWQNVFVAAHDMAVHVSENHNVIWLNNFASPDYLMVKAWIRATVLHLSI